MIEIAGADGAVLELAAFCAFEHAVELRAEGHRGECETYTDFGVGSGNSGGWGSGNFGG